MSGFLTPVRRVETRPDPDTDRDATRYVRSYLWMRIGIGVLGIALPLLLVFIDKGAFHGNPFPRGSLSVYYYSGMRDEFVAILSATGIFLITYKVAERNLDNAASLLAGMSAIVIPLFPTGLPPYAHVSLTPLQKLIGESATRWVHFTASVTFLVSLALITFFFGVREREPACAAGEALTEVLGLVPLDLHHRDGSRAPVDRDHAVGRLAAAGLAVRRMGLSVGVRRLMAGERRRTRHALRQAR